MRLVLDSCSIILLGKATILETLTESHKLIIPKEVYDEVIKGKEAKHIDALIMEKLCKERIIEKKSIENNKVLQKIEMSFGLGRGEAEALALIMENEYDALVTDNKQGRKTAKIMNLKLLGSPELVVALYKEKKIDKNKAISALKKLEEFGWYEKYLIEEIMEEVKNE